MAKHFQSFGSVEEFQRANPQDRPLVASITDGGGKVIFFRSSAGRESYLTQGAAPFRFGISPLGGQAVLTAQKHTLIEV